MSSVLSSESHADPLLAWRDEFPILSQCTYLINNSLGAMTRTLVPPAA